jgi:hypothetical protein
MPTFGNSRPQRPDEVRAQRITQFPDAVFDGVNALLAKNILKNTITVSKTAVVDAIREFDASLTQEVLLENNWLDFEPAYDQYGWRVTYESPDWGSSGPGYYTFVKKPRPTPADT